MSLKIDRVQLDIVINNDQARQSLRKLEGEYRDLAKEQKKFATGSEDWERIKQQMIQVKMKMDKVYESIGIANLSLKELRMRQSELNAVLGQMSPSMKGYSELKAEADAVGNRIKELNGKAKDTGFSIGKIADRFNRYFAFVTAGLASLTGLIFSLRKVVDIANLFEERVDNLSALTGLLGSDLDWLSEEAKKLSTSVIEGNIRIKSSATEIVDAYTKVGSKRPELLKVKEDLNAVTQEAMILAEASKSELQPAVDGLTMVLNQFNAPAEDSRRIINILAAGSKAGAGEVDYLTAAFEKSGSVASSFGVSVEELTGIFETLAPRMTEPEMAGRSLRNIMIKLETQSDDNLKPSMVGLGQAFEELHKQQWSVTQLTELFGTENINAANILVNNTEETKKYTAAVTGTNVALEQAAINTDNNATKLQQAKNKVEVLSIEFGQKLAPAMTLSTNAFAAFMRVMMAAPEFVHQYNIALIALVGALLAYNGGMIKSTAVKIIDNLLLKEGIGLKIKDAIVLQALIVKEQLLTIWKGNGTVATKLATTAQYAWNAALSANPIGLIITAVTALVVAVKTYDKYNAESVRLEKEKTTAINNVKNANDLLQKTYETQQTKIGELNKLGAEQKRILLQQVDATLKAAEAELELAKAKQVNIEKDNTRTTLWQKFTNSILASGNPAAFAAMEATDAVMNGMEASKTLDDGIKSISDSIKQLRGQSSDLNQIVNAEKYSDEITGRSINQLEEKQRYLTTALKNYEKGSADYIRISKKLSDVTKQLQDDVKKPGDDIKSEIEQLQSDIKAANDAIIQMIATGTQPPQAFLDNLKALEQRFININNAVAVAKNGFESYIKLSADVAIDDNTDFSTPSDNASVDPQIMPEYSQEALALEQELANRKNEIVQLGINGARDLLMAASQAQYDHDMMLMDTKYATEEKKLKDQLDRKTISQEQYDTRIAILDKKRSADELKLKRKQALREKEIATLGIGVELAKTLFEIKAKAAAFIAGVTTAPLAAIALAQIPWVLGAAALQTGLVWAQPMPQAFTGRGYDVTGAQDKRAYKNVPYVANATTGLYQHPTLIGDHGSEIVIDHQRSRNITMNYPEILQAIRAVPQHYSGRVPDSSPGTQQFASVTDPLLLSIIQENTKVMKQLMDKGVKGTWVLNDLDKIQKNKSTLESSVDM